MAEPKHATGNKVLDSVPAATLDDLRPHLQPVHLDRRQTLYATNDPIERIYFPISSIGSWLSVFRSGATMEIATIGNEGVIGVSAVFGMRQLPFLVLNQVPGEALEISATVFERAVRGDPALQAVMGFYIDAFIVQLGQSSACNGLHSVSERCARWLLMTQDRAKGDEFAMTHELLAEMLGVARPTVSEVLSDLQNSGAIRYNWGTIGVLDRAGLEAASCECYEIIASAYEHVQLPPG